MWTDTRIRGMARMMDIPATGRGSASGSATMARMAACALRPAISIISEI
jgi:hypothetical protein